MNTSSLALVAFQRHLGDVFISPQDLTFSTEVGIGDQALVEKGYLRISMPDYCFKAECAIKSFRPEVTLDPRDIKKVVEEAKALRALQHRYSITFRDVAQHHWISGTSGAPTCTPTCPSINGAHSYTSLSRSCMHAGTLPASWASAPTAPAAAARSTDRCS